MPAEALRSMLHSSTSTTVRLRVSPGGPCRRVMYTTMDADDNRFRVRRVNTYNEDPTNLAARNGYQYDYLTSGVGYGNVYLNSKWIRCLQLDQRQHHPGAARDAERRERQQHPVDRVPARGPHRFPRQLVSTLFRVG